MSLTNALTGALTGLRAASRATQLISENIANAMNENYGRRSLSLKASGLRGPGVAIVGINRHVDSVLLSTRRSADADLSMANTTLSFWNDAESILGGPDDPNSVAAKLTQFETALIQAAADPSNANRLQIVAEGAASLADKIKSASHDVQALRLQADHDIAREVEALNKHVEDVQNLNRRIRMVKANGGAVESFMDQRQAIIDQINAIVPVNPVDIGSGQLGLRTDSGVVLLDHSAVAIDFSAVTHITPYMTHSNSQLAGLSALGTALDSGPVRHSLGGGRLEALFRTRDEFAVQVQNDLDVVARDLVERFQSSTVDPTLGPADAGLFTDAGGFFTAPNTEGLSYRLEINTIVDPKLTNDFWRLRSGLGTVGPGDAGDASLLHAFEDALNGFVTPNASSFGTVQKDASGMIATMMSRVGFAGSQAELAQTFAAASQQEAQRVLFEQGVDTDAELQTLLVLEKTYAANARLVDIVDDLFEQLLRI